MSVSSSEIPQHSTPASTKYWFQGFVGFFLWYNSWRVTCWLFELLHEVRSKHYIWEEVLPILLVQMYLLVKKIQGVSSEVQRSAEQWNSTSGVWSLFTIRQHSICLLRTTAIPVSYKYIPRDTPALIKTWYLVFLLWMWEDRKTGSQSKLCCWFVWVPVKFGCITEAVGKSTHFALKSFLLQQFYFYVDFLLLTKPNWQKRTTTSPKMDLLFASYIVLWDFTL